jgi:hypothetical protein
MKKFLLFSIVLSVLALSLISASAWPARFTVWNQTVDDIYIQMDYPYTNLMVPAGEKVEFTINRNIYNVKLIACGVEAKGLINLTRNLKLNLTPCQYMYNAYSPKYLGEPSMEKVNFFRVPGIGWQFWY